VTLEPTQEGRRPVGAGLFFSLGHSTIAAALVVAYRRKRCDEIETVAS
jgi:high-affinity nickel permease